MRNSTYTTRWNGATPPTIPGNQIARKHYTKAQRARIAAALMDGAMQLGPLNQRQIANLCGVSVTYALRQRRPQSALQLQQAAE
jgi:hypothetical protein